MDKKTLNHKKEVIAAVPPTQPGTPVTEMLLLEYATSQQNGGNPSVGDMVANVYVNLDAKNQQVRQVGEGTEDQDVIVRSQLNGYLQKGSQSIAGLFLSTSGGMMVGNIDMGTNQGDANTIVGLPYSWGGSGYLGNDYIASVGIVKDILGDYGDRLNDLIEKITKYAGSGEGSMDQLLKDLGSPKENTGLTPAVTFEKPKDAKWLLLSAKNAMTGPLRLEQKQGALPTEPEPTIKNLKTGDVVSVGTATSKDDLQKIVTVSDLNTILNSLKGNNSSSGSSQGSGTTTQFPDWTGQEVPCLVSQNPATPPGGSTQNLVESSNADNYINEDNGTYTLLRRGVYLVTFAYEVTPSQNGVVTCTGILKEKTTTTTTRSSGSQPAASPVAPAGSPPKDPDASETVFTIVGSSGQTLLGSSYILVPGDKASSEHTLELKLTTGDAGSTTDATASKSYVAISYMGAGY
ncbi:hypothetical protein [Chlamydia sp.]|uniref:hypothetical protein n=1 Tax=Chlamydia sp. TaxID=35827 RepID=UPI0025BBA992|nr:hypothetical protein [Chlamydia sp.]MBQ8498429.1 hypothetical protein [Chlamydia sp.]